VASTDWGYQLRWANQKKTELSRVRFIWFESV